ncbi:hypothetical protein [Leyella stercorea]|uniref:hypothetical protein n=1 Tax=Leyella stercorea TaxID=363265 RepID=UPI001FE0F35C|nr:hypothetical protein [Leyella stercorea]
MKRFILLLVLSIIYATSIFAQQKFFCEIKGAEKELLSGLKIVFDFGKNSVYGSLSSLKSKQKIVDDKGEVISFNSMVDDLVKAGLSFKHIHLYMVVRQ